MQHQEVDFIKTFLTDGVFLFIKSFGLIPVEPFGKASGRGELKMFKATERVLPGSHIQRESLLALPQSSKG